jgi:hypothetical protein
MKIQYRKLTIGLFSGLTLLISSCDYGDLNTDPNNPTEVTLASLMAGAQGEMGYTLGSDVSRYNSLFTQHMAGIDRQHLQIGNYQFEESNSDNLWNSQMYGQTLKDLDFIIKQGTENGSPGYVGIGQVLMANGLGILADMYNDIPYSEAFKGIENLNPRYDTQEKIYQSIQTLLDDAIVNLANPDNVFTPGADDFIFGGDFELWTKTAYSLKARYYNHLSIKDPNGSATNALNALSLGAISDNSENCVFVFGISETNANPWYQWNDQRGDTRMGAPFIDIMNGLSDPRIGFFAAKNDSDLYVGAVPSSRNGSDPSKGSPSDMGTYYGSINSPIVFMSFAETKFIEAEAQLRAGNSLDAASAFNAAVIASLNEVTGTADAGYVTANASETAASITLEKIMTQKYIALYTQPETFNDVRRTNIPALTEPSGSVKPGLGLIKRWPYPSSERVLNPNATKVNGEPLFTAVWWN